MSSSNSPEDGGEVYYDIPSYEEALKSSSHDDPPPTTKAPEKPSIASSMASQLQDVRDDRIRKLIDSYILPQLEAQISEGLSRRGLFLVPSDFGPKTSVWGEPANSKPESAFRKVIKLQGSEFEGPFWQQPLVLKELGQALVARFIKDGQQVRSTTPKVPSVPHMTRYLISTSVPLKTDSSSRAPNQISPGRRRSLFSRLRSELSVTAEKPSVPPMKLGWRDDKSDAKTKGLAAGELRFDVGLKPIFNVPQKNDKDVGNQEKLTGQAIWVDFEVGG